MNSKVRLPLKTMLDEGAPSAGTLLGFQFSLCFTLRELKG